jgi:hypothetical protein
MGFSFSAPKNRKPTKYSTNLGKTEKDNITLGYVILVAVVAVAVGGAVEVRIVENVWVKGGIGWRSGPGGKLDDDDDDSPANSGVAHTVPSAK